MTSRLPFYFVDVFATRPLTGNPLSLVPDADDLGEAQMQAIAREFNQSETTFLQRPSLPGATVRLRSFTPAGVEVGGAGHNALGAWLWLENAGRLAAAATDGGLRQEISGEVLPVEVVRTAGQPAMVWMDQSPPRFGAVAGERRGLLPVQPRSGGRRRRGRLREPAQQDRRVGFTAARSHRRLRLGRRGRDAGRISRPLAGRLTPTRAATVPSAGPG